MKYRICIAASLLLGMSLAAPVQAQDSADKDVFMKCLAVAYEQYQGDPDPKMKDHWKEFIVTYRASAYHYAKSEDFIRENLRGEMDKFANMREVMGNGPVNNLALALLKRCDEDVISNPERVSAYLDALKQWSEKHPQ